MLIDPKQKLKNIFFYNNLLLIVCIFSIICLITAFSIENTTTAKKTYYDIQEGTTYGPIEVSKGKPVILEFKTSMHGSNKSVYLSGEVQDADRDTLYEFGKEMLHEDGYDSEGYWSESDRDMKASLSFTEPGTYYVQFNSEYGVEGNRINDVYLTIQRKKGSGIPHLMMGVYSLILSLLTFVIFNRKWVSEKLAAINEKLEEMSDD